ncbi:cytochrome P450 [Melanogaster broomeanus]|nr:cytochrome P450 [Melanogaster broomeanus]
MEAIHNRNVPSPGFIHARSGVSPRSCFPLPSNLKLKDRVCNFKMKIQHFSLNGWQVASVVLACVASGVSSGPADSRDESDAYISHRDQPFLHTVSERVRSSPQQIQQRIKQYDPVIALTNGEDFHVIIGRPQEAVLLTEKQGAVGLKFVQMSACARFRMYRKAAHSELQMKATLIYANDQTQYARNIVLDILKEPESHQGHIKRYVLASIPYAWYHVASQVLGDDDSPSDIWTDDADVSKRFLHPPSAVHGSHRIQGALMPGAHKLGNLEHEQFINNVRQTKKGLDDHTKPHSVAGALLSKPALGMSEDEMVYFCGSLVGASYDTTQVTISTILMAAAHFPDIQEIVHAEIDPVVGRETVVVAPSFENWCTLTKLHAFSLEALRWRPVNPLGVPHRAAKDVIWAQWLLHSCQRHRFRQPLCISRDPEVFPDPDAFDINRWTDRDGNLNDLKAYSFGFGRRICPGLNLANRAMFTAGATVMWAFTIKEDFSNRYNAFELPAALVLHHKPYSILYEPRTDVRWLKEVMSGQMYKSFDVDVARNVSAHYHYLLAPS